MGNRSSSPRYPPGWPPYGSPPSGFNAGGKFNQYPTLPGHPHQMQIPHYRSMISLNEQPQPYVIHDSVDRRMYMHGSRVSLNQMRMDNVMIPDAKTLKKMEKIDKKQRKMNKKLMGKGPPGGHPIVPGPIMHQSIYPAPSQLYTRALSYDDLQRAQLDMADMRLREQWLRSHPEKVPKYKNTVSDKSSVLRREWNGGSLSSSSPMTSSSDEKSIDQWIKDKRSDSSLRSKNEPLFSSTPHSSRPSSKGEHQIEIKIERREKIERRQERTDSASSIYAQPIARQRRQSTSSYGNSPMRADQSEIDFSWVQDEEKRISRERDRESMPECYFGMEPPKVEDSKVKKTAHILEEEARLQRIREREIDNQDRTGPAERRLHRLQRESEPKPVRDTQRPWRNSMAY